MTPRQLTAYRAPCYRAWETTADDYRLILVTPRATWSTILSVNK